jgi:NAD+ kinase
MGALLPDSAVVTIDVLEANKRPVAAAADHAEVRFVRTVETRLERIIAMHMLFGPGHALDERILHEQFGV